MRAQRLTETQHAVLAATKALDGAGYAALIQKKILQTAKMEISYGRIHNILARFEAIGWLVGEWGQGSARLGRRSVRVYRVTMNGETGLETANAARKRVGMLR